MTRTQFRERFNVRYCDPAFDTDGDAIARLEAIAWAARQDKRKAPLTWLAGPEFADPTYKLSVQRLDTRTRRKAAQQLSGTRIAPSRVPLNCGSAQNDGICPVRA